jgi:GrpB-like predicted nucleotidyltransferase (UPF0157 family)
MSRNVEVVPHDPNWHSAFVHESRLVAGALGDAVVAIHHIGSTAIHPIYAKPIIDLLVEVDVIAKVDPHDSAMQAIGYEVMGEFGMPGRRYFRKDNPAGIRTHHIHVFAANSAQVVCHLTFRDYLRVHPEAAQQYSELKQHLAKLYPNDIDAYIDGKDELIKTIDKKAAAWRIASIK